MFPRVSVVWATNSSPRLVPSALKIWTKIFSSQGQVVWLSCHHAMAKPPSVSAVIVG
jgi:hypothetical protein